MNILAIDTAEDACSAALLVDGAVHSRFEIAPRRHSELILPMMDQLLAEAGLALRGLDAIAFGRGPGSFTGVRIAAAVAQGAAFAADRPVVPVSTLQALAARARRESGAGNVLAALDARMGEVYWSGVPAGAAEGDVRVEQVLSPEAVPVPGAGRWTGVGSGWRAYADVLNARLGSCLDRVDPTLRVHAHDVAVLGGELLQQGRAVAPDQAVPVYLRDEVAWKKPAPAG
jgi:tRNA threonylcarbamoyladenosine biosynthesis protein TsaB